MRHTIEWTFHIQKHVSCYSRIAVFVLNARHKIDYVINKAASMHKICCTAGVNLITLHVPLKARQDHALYDLFNATGLRNVTIGSEVLGRFRRLKYMCNSRCFPVPGDQSWDHKVRTLPNVYFSYWNYQSQYEGKVFIVICSEEVVHRTRLVVKYTTQL